MESRANYALIGLFVLYRRLRSMSRVAAAELSADERERAARLLSGAKEEQS